MFGRLDGGAVYFVPPVPAGVDTKLVGFRSDGGQRYISIPVAIGFDRRRCTNARIGREPVQKCTGQRWDAFTSFAFYERRVGVCLLTVPRVASKILRLSTGRYRTTYGFAATGAGSSPPCTISRNFIPARGFDGRIMYVVVDIYYYY